jgi:hypothetical protein
MKKALTLVVFALVVAACGGSSDGEDAAATTAPSLAESDSNLAEGEATTTTTTTTTTEAPATTTTTEAPATTTTTEPDTGVFPSGDPDIDAVATAYMVAFDSTTDYETKLPYVDDLSGLEDTVLQYLETGDTMGGVSVVVTSVEINGDEAAVKYDLLFNNRPIYPDLPGTAVKTEAGWQVTRKEFCGMMSSARVGCPVD